MQSVVGTGVVWRRASRPAGLLLGAMALAWTVACRDAAVSPPAPAATRTPAAVPYVAEPGSPVFPLCGEGERGPGAPAIRSVAVPASDRRPDVLLVTVDTLRPDHLHSYGYPEPTSPNIDRLSREGVRFARVVSAAPVTAPSHATLLTGVYPFAHGVRANGDYVLSPENVTLAEVLKQNGFATAAFVGSFVLDRQFQFDQGFEQYDDDLSGGMDSTHPLAARSWEHRCQVWKLDEEVGASPGRAADPAEYRVAVRHGPPGAAGAFRIVLFRDADGNGGPETPVAASGSLAAAEPNQWSEAVFRTVPGGLFVGACWDDPDAKIILHKLDRAPQHLRGISSVAFLSDGGDRPFNRRLKGAMADISVTVRTADGQTHRAGFASRKTRLWGGHWIDEFERRAGAVNAAALAWLGARRDEPRPLFLWVHYFDPHADYDPPEPHRSRFAKPYDGEISYVDAALGDLVAALAGRRDAGLLTVVTSDHGEAFGEHGEEQHGHFLYDTTMLVPLVLHWPGVLPERSCVPAAVRTADVFPTVLDLLGLRPPSSIDGVSLRGLVEGTAGAPTGAAALAYGETQGLHRASPDSSQELRMLRAPTWKRIERPGLAAGLYFDLERDSAEAANLDAGLSPERKAELQRTFDSVRAQRAERSSSVEMDESTREKMRALGYVE